MSTQASLCEVDPRLLPGEAAMRRDAELIVTAFHAILADDDHVVVLLTDRWDNPGVKSPSRADFSAVTALIPVGRITTACRLTCTDPAK
jgi:hypothetical protein